jgi:sugar transferase (PEP-CTERM/EpsH1 system associated)
MMDSRPPLFHVVYSFDTGGLENGIVKLINRLPRERYAHAVVALTHCSPEFCGRVVPDDVHFIELRKPPGHAFRLYPALYRLFRELKPAIVHTRNLAALEAQAPARAAGVPVRIHGEHGWDVTDPDGSSLKYRIMRRLYKPFVSHYVALSAHLASYLTDCIGVAPERVTRICNGVDTHVFHPAAAERELLPGSPFNEDRFRIVGTVGRLQAIKDQLNLIRAFALMLERTPQLAAQVRLMIVGDGPLRAAVSAEVTRLGLDDKVWLAGERDDVAEAMRAMDVFALPSRAEGISNTILEAMASGLPVVATDVGATRTRCAGETGMLVPARDPGALADALSAYVIDPAKASAHGRAGRIREHNRSSVWTAWWPAMPSCTNRRWSRRADQAGTGGAHVVASIGHRFLP